MQDRHQGWVALLAIAAAFGLGLHFIHLRHTEEATRACRANLEQIQAAKEQFALDHNGVGPASFAELIPAYLAVEPTCPKAGTYTLGSLTNAPVCSFARHGTPEE